MPPDGDCHAASAPIPLPPGEGYYIKTWEERNQNLLRAVQMEKLIIRLIVMMIVVASSASIFLVLFMAVHTKVRELGIDGLVVELHGGEIRVADHAVRTSGAAGVRCIAAAVVVEEDIRVDDDVLLSQGRSRGKGSDRQNQSTAMQDLSKSQHIAWTS